eukprot:scaffold119923_cov65-Attheya_sp.AAC.1
MVVSMVDNYNPKQPFVFTKLNIKESCWYMVVADEDTWNFCYVMPVLDKIQKLVNDSKLLVPRAQQMGCSKSSPFFCSGSEIEHNVMECLLSRAKLLHKFEMQMLQKSEELLPCTNLLDVTAISNRLKVCNM